MLFKSLSWLYLWPVFASQSTGTTALQSRDGEPSVLNCADPASTLHLSDPPYENFFYSDCHSAGQVVVTSPAPDSNLTIIGPRLLVAWPAGNSGIVSFFEPENGLNGTLGISLANFSSVQQPLQGIYEEGRSPNPYVGISGLLQLNGSALLSVAILGSIRNIRDFTEGPSILEPLIQNATAFSVDDSGVALIQRTWFDNETETRLSFAAAGDVDSRPEIGNQTVRFAAGTYVFNASFNYPQLEQLSSQEVLNPVARDLISQNPDETASLSFLSYKDKLLAGAWRFLTYFGRDSMISALLLQPILSEGEGSAIEAVIEAVLERINRTDGTVAHEETIGDHATYLSIQNNETSTAPQYDYKMVDTEYFLPVLMKNYFLDAETGRQRSEAFFSTQASINPDNEGLAYADLALVTAERIMNTSAPFASDRGQVKGNLIRLKEDQVVGEWRDSTYGIGGGRIPYDVNVALVPAALRAIQALSAVGLFPTHPEWEKTAGSFAQTWEDNTLQFFKVTVPADEARDLVDAYVSESGFSGPSESDGIVSDVVYHGLALDGNYNRSIVKVMNSDDCFRLFFLNTTDQTQLSHFLNQTAAHVLQPFPVGLSTSVGILVANPAYGGDPVYTANFTNNSYHGTVVWGWQLAMLAKGLERQLGRCDGESNPGFCADPSIYDHVREAYNHLWDILEANRAALGSEVWSWVYDGGYKLTPLGALPPPPGSNPTESNIRQLWSLTFLAVTRNEAFR
ncbi:glycogen debranching enzyme [Eremomyces bilateralis CBS 781.70]|uniref:Glycogen debranching enzyme n=1 Tax=Eremomyces bilateralis CBS 781.70 TaxID=1392243 RepID=A0A6G1GEC0_9PEZI|nr:glycogen debranching enzyme [Eremomyces bilateralis CBS 781.70]KAF1816256.1 glycogen debranching enzyme [Eremomyces bilateralis CBS 781.70]